MATETYTARRENLASYLDRVTDDREVLLVKRRGARDVAILPADELAGLLAQRLLKSLRELDRGKGEATTVEALRRSLGLGKAG
jgi:antitoxin YefM